MRHQCFLGLSLCLDRNPICRLGTLLRNWIRSSHLFRHQKTEIQSGKMTLTRRVHDPVLGGHLIEMEV